jgi:hypothetical protein
VTGRQLVVGVVWCAVLGALATPSAALAYLDPTSGSMLLQLLLGGVAGIAVAIRLFWHRFVGFFARKSDDDES